MGIIKRAGDLVYTFRFLRLLTTPFEETEAFKRGIIDKDGKRRKEFTLNTMDNRDIYKDFYTPFHRLVFNIKKLLAKAPGGSSRLGSYAAALYLLREEFSISDKKIEQGLKELGIDPLDFLEESSNWFLSDDKKLVSDSYKLTNDKILNKTFEDIIRKGDRVIVEENCYPIGQIFGLDLYEVTHFRTKQPVVVTVSELAR
tara:strand:+ start:4517 stop:5116 length:600 start_codon:yes stop_codon:yes gene_type:complete